MTRPKLAIFDFACCEGCQLQIVNMEEEILDLISVVTPVEWREAMSEQSETYDIAIVEGSITRASDEEKLRKIRERAKYLIALGTCATTGGVNKAKNNFELDDVKRCVYGDAAQMPHLETQYTKSVEEVVKVDFKIQGCPIDRKEFAYVIRCIAFGKTPELPNYPVCVECKLKENLCRYEYGEICLGPITNAGCGALCPSCDTWCYGCRGILDDANIQGTMETMKKYGKTVEELKNRMNIFGSKQRDMDE